MAMRISLPAGWGEAWLHEPGEHRRDVTGTVRSYDHRGRQLVWVPPAGAVRAACDLEDPSRPSDMMATGLGVGTNGFTRRWVATEVLAKLRDVPILAWLKQRGLSGADGGGEGACRDGDGARVVVRESATTGDVAAFGLLEKADKD